MTTVQLRGAGKKPYFVVGLLTLAVLLVSIFARETLNARVSPAFLRDWRYVSGAALLAVYLFQWTLFFTRRSGDAHQVRKQYSLHKIGGVTFLALFVLHAGVIGYGLMGFVAVTIVLVAATGLFNAEVLLLVSEKWRWARLMLHYALAALVGPLLMLHAWTALSHK